MSEDLKKLAGKIIEEAYNKGNLNVLDELDQLLNPGGGAGEGKQGDSLFPRLYTVGMETPVVIASYGKSWSTYYRISNFTDRFDAAPLLYFSFVEKPTTFPSSSNSLWMERPVGRR